jgi:hypothetical protein
MSENMDLTPLCATRTAANNRGDSQGHRVSWWET